MRPWSGEIFWNEDWNRDINFSDAFRTSCVWYFRQVTDDIGKVKMQNELNKLKYGNCDISDWEGKLNTNNNNRALTGFWIVSAKYCYATHELRLHQNDRCKRFTLF